jgi:hypothetical protein
MRLDRRTFIVGTGLAVVMPIPEFSPGQLAAQAADIDSLVFMIEGWSADDSRTSNKVWFRLDQSWRAAWR